MSNFRDFISEENHTSEAKNDTNLNKEEMEDLINKYSKYSEDDLMMEFMKMTYDKKKKGDLGSEELMNIKNTIEPFLNSEQKTKLEKIINMVDNVK